VTAWLPGVTDEGTNEQSRSAGKSEQDKTTALLKEPDCGATVMVRLPLVPAARLSDDGDAPTVTLLLVDGVPQFSAIFTAFEI